MDQVFEPFIVDEEFINRAAEAYDLMKQYHMAGYEAKKFEGYEKSPEFLGPKQFAKISVSSDYFRTGLIKLVGKSNPHYDYDRADKEVVTFVRVTDLIEDWDDVKANSMADIEKWQKLAARRKGKFDKKKEDEKRKNDLAELARLKKLYPDQ